MSIPTRLLCYARRKPSNSNGWWIFGCIFAAWPLSTLMVFKELHRSISAVTAANAIGLCEGISAFCFAMNAIRSGSFRERLWSLFGVACACVMLFRAPACARSDYFVHNIRVKCGYGVNPNPQVSLNMIRLATGWASLGPVASFKGFHQLPSDYVAIVDLGSGRPKIASVTRPDPGGPFIITSEDDDVYPSSSIMVVISVTDVPYNITTTIELPLQRENGKDAKGTEGEKK